MIIGDGLAEGYGDDRLAPMRMPGLTTTMNQQILKTKSIRQKWQVVSNGLLGSTSKDWLPDNALFKSTLVSRKYGDAEIVLLMVGFEDYKSSISQEETLENIKRIALDLSNRGKIVYVAKLPRMPKEYDHGAPRAMPEQPHVEFVNDMLEKWIKSQSNKKIRLGADYSSYELYWRKDCFMSDTYAEAGRTLKHFSHKGYEKAVELWMEVLTNDIVKAEYEVFSKKLLNGK